MAPDNGATMRWRDAREEQDMPAAKDGHGDKEGDVRRLFAELDAAYQRAAEAASPAVLTDTSNRGKLVEEGGKALAIIQRIRETDGL